MNVNDWKKHYSRFGKYQTIEHSHTDREGVWYWTEMVLLCRMYEGADACFAKYFMKAKRSPEYGREMSHRKSALKIYKSKKGEYVNFRGKRYYLSI